MREVEESPDFMVCLVAMNEKMLTPNDFTDKAAKPAPAAPSFGRVVPLPENLDLGDVMRMTAEELNKHAIDFGAGFGYAVILKMASGKGEVPAGIQLKAAEFLKKNADEILADRRDDDAGEKIKRMDRGTLLAFINRLTAEIAADAPVISSSASN